MSLNFSKGGKLITVPYNIGKKRTAGRKVSEDILNGNYIYVKATSASWKIDLQLAKTEHFSDSGRVSGAANLRRVKVTVQEQPEKRGVRICKKNNSVNTKATAEGGEEGALCAKADAPAAVVKTMVKQAVPLQLMEFHGRVETHLQTTYPWQSR